MHVLVVCCNIQLLLTLIDSLFHFYELSTRSLIYLSYKYNHIHLFQLNSYGVDSTCLSIRSLPKTGCACFLSYIMVRFKVWASSWTFNITWIPNRFFVVKGFSVPLAVCPAHCQDMILWIQSILLLSDHF